MAIHSHKNQAALNAVPDLSAGATGQVIAKSSGGSLEFITVSGGSGGDAVKKTITQSAHGLSAGNVLYYDGSAYALAKADDEVTAEVAGIIESVTDTNNFVLNVSGFVAITGMTWTPGAVYRLSEATAGALTATDTPGGQIFKPLLTAISSTTGWFSTTLGVIKSTSVSMPNPSAIFSVDGYVANLELLDLTTDAVATNTATGFTSLHGNAAKVSGLYKGFLLGYASGTTAGSSSNNILDALKFSDLARLNLNVAIGTSQGRQSGVWSDSFGYFVGGSNGEFFPGRRNIVRVALSTDVVTNYSQTLADGNSRHCSVGFNAVDFDRGYVGGMWSYSTSIYYVKYSDATHGTSGASMTESLGFPGGFTDGAKGYIGGGYLSSSTHRDYIDELDYTTVARTRLTATLSVARGWVQGASGFTKGYFCKGWTGPNTLPVASNQAESFDFATQTITSLGSSLFTQGNTANVGCWQTHGIK